MTDFTDYKTASKWSPEINRGCSDRMRQKWGMEGVDPGDPLTVAQQAYMHGWNTTDAAENKAGQVMGRSPCASCGGGPVFCRDCMGGE